MRDTNSNPTSFPDFFAFECISNALANRGYSSLQYIPGSHHSRLGAEFSILRAYLFNTEAVVLRGSRFHSIYQKIVKYTRPATYKLADLFFRCQPLSAANVSEIFDANELNKMVSEGIISKAGESVTSNFRFVPIDDILIACSPIHDSDQENFVYFGSDTIMFRDLIENLISDPVENTLEIGCGSGFLSICMAKMSRTVMATDISQRALSITRANAAMNDARNVTAVESDVYSNVEGRFDVIISNPPYMFLPDAESRRAHAYGGHFGMTITHRILQGLETHLGANGIALIFSDSYVLDDGTDTLCRLLVDTLHGQPWEIIAVQFDYQPVRGHADFYRQHHVRHAIRYLVSIRRSSSFSFATEKLGAVSRTVQTFKLRLSKRS